MPFHRATGPQVGVAWEFVRVPCWTLLLSVVVGVVNGLIFGVVLLAPAATTGQVTVGDVLLGAPGYGAMVGISMWPLGLLLATAAVVVVRRGRDVRIVSSVVTTVALVVVALTWLAVGHEFVPNDLGTPWVMLVLAAVGAGAASLGLVWLALTMVLTRSSPNGAGEESPAVDTAASKVIRPAKRLVLLSASALAPLLLIALGIGLWIYLDDAHLMEVRLINEITVGGVAVDPSSGETGRVRAGTTTGPVPEHYEFPDDVRFGSLEAEDDVQIEPYQVQEGDDGGYFSVTNESVLCEVLVANPDETGSVYVYAWCGEH